MTSCAKCKRETTPAQHEDCMHRMSDGRQFTQYVSSCSDFYGSMGENNIASSYDMRMFLMNNAEKLMAENARRAESGVRCVCEGKTPAQSPAPRDVSKCTDKRCVFSEGDANGLGLYRAHA